LLLVAFKFGSVGFLLDRATVLPAVDLDWSTSSCSYFWVVSSILSFLTNNWPVSQYKEKEKLSLFELGPSIHKFSYLLLYDAREKIDDVLGFQLVTLPRELVLFCSFWTSSVSSSANGSFPAWYCPFHLQNSSQCVNNTRKTTSYTRIQWNK
jgi:hypothetical protein